MRSIIRSGSVLLGAQIFAALVGVGAMRLYTELAPPQVFGESNLILTMLGLAMQLFVAPFTASQLRYHSEAQVRNEGDRFSREALVWSLRSAVLLATTGGLAFAVYHSIWGGKVGNVAAIAASIWLIAMTVRNVLMNRLQAERRQVVYGSLLAVEAILLATLTGLALAFSASVGSFLIGQALAVAALGALIIARTPWPAAEVTRGHANAGFLGKVISYGAPFVPMALFSWVANLADRYAVAFLLGSAAAGEYVAPFAIASRGMALANVALNDLFRPMLFDAENRREEATVNYVFGRWIAVNLAISLAALLFIYFAGGLVAKILLAQEYRAQAVGVMLWVSMAYAVFGFTQILETRLLSLGRSARLLPSMVLGAIANIAFSFVLVSRNGILGAAQATCASFAVQSLSTALILHLALRHRKAILCS